MREVPLHSRKARGPRVPGAVRGCVPRLLRGLGFKVDRGTSLIRTPPPLGPYRKPMPRDL